MSNSDRSTPGVRSPALLRGLALLLMIIGAVGFMVAVVLYREQVLCLASSTLLVIVGLGMRLMYRPAEAQVSGPEAWQPTQSKRRARLPIERSVRRGSGKATTSVVPQPPPPASQPAQAPVSQAGPEETPDRTDPAAPDPYPAAMRESPDVMPSRPAGQEDVGPLARQVIAIFRGQNARVAVDASRAERTVLRVVSLYGDERTVLVLEGNAPVDVGEARALFALMTSQHSSGGFLVTGGAFSQQAVDWASERGIQLTGGDRLEDLVL